MALTSKPLAAPPGLAIRAAIALRRSLLRAAEAVVPARVAILERVIASGEANMLGELARLRVADLLEQGPLSAIEIAERTGTNADAMARTLRALAYTGVFSRRSDGRFENNRVSRALLDEDDSSRAFAMYFASKSNQHAWADFPETLRTGKNAFDRVHGSSVWDWFDAHPDERETFARAMMSITIAEGAGIATTYPFGETQKVCDVGGGRGTLLSEILLHHPKVQGVLVDAPGVLESAKSLLDARGVRERVQLVPGSFFDSVPSGADVYVLKTVLHDWDDERSIKILSVVRSAMKPGARLAIVDFICEADCDHYGVMVDMQMMLVCGEGRERSRGDFERLLQATGFRIERLLFTSTGMGIVEGVAV
jgi:O-methyltransferase domain